MKPSRHMLTGEISWAMIAICYAWSGMGGWPLAPSYLYRMLERQGEQWIWTLVIGIPALVLLVVSSREWFANLRRTQWDMFRIERSSRLRGRLCLVMLVSWLYMFMVMLRSAFDSMFPNGAQALDAPRANAMLPLALFGVICMFWFWWENKRVQRDVRKATGVFPAYPSC